jgi:hypothetical protein
MRRNQRLCGLLALCCSLAAKGALAQGNTKITAEALFQEGRRLMGEKRPAEACPKFAESQRLDPSPGTLLNLASCYETTGRLASAWATYKEAASAASAAGRAENLAVANKHADSLVRRLTRLTVRAPRPPEGLAITRDGAPLDMATLGVAIPVDPGEHTVEATAPGKRPWSTKVAASAEGASLTVEIPTLADAPAAPPPPPPPASGEPGPVASPPGVDEPARPAPTASVRTAGFVVGAVGLVGLGVGTWFAVSARSKFDDSLSSCAPDDQNRCSSAGVTRRGEARTDGSLATVAFSVGGAALAAGVALVLFAPGNSDPASARLRIAPALGGATLGGAF